MGSVYKAMFTKPLPTGAKIIVRKGQRIAEWKDAKGKTRTAPLTAAGDRIALEAGTYTAKYRDGNSQVQKVTTGCRDKTAAESVLAELEKRADKVRSGMRTADEDAVIDQLDVPLAEHVIAYLTHLEAEGTCPEHRDNVDRCLKRLARECGFTKLANLTRDSFERWLVAKAKAGMSARTRNSYRSAAVAFCNWCIDADPPRLMENPLAKVPKGDENADKRRERRALTEDELRRLLDVARRRPVLSRATVYRGKRKGEVYAKLRDETRRKLERLGTERALIYKTLVLTGLRKGELASLTVGQLVLDAAPPFLVLKAADEKNRNGSTIPIRADLAADLRGWLAEKAKAAVEAARDVPVAGSTLPPDTPVFTVPAGLRRILDRDLKLAGIPKRDDRGRTVDVHALRHTFGTLLSKGGVTPRTAQAAMRHSKIDLTMNVYTDPRLLDVAGAMESLPMLPLSAGSQMEANDVKANGAEDSTILPLVPVLVPTSAKPGLLESILDKVTREPAESGEKEQAAEKGLPVQHLRPLSTVDNGRQGVGVTRLELVTSSLSSWRSNQLS